ncbi:hypothetical protein C8Q74DRAFT_1250903 [Fomes fomentarius]|nr:hypothetical protein C8Q74DRAFT_1250903 [Fomes fomentarius]
MQNRPPAYAPLILALWPLVIPATLVRARRSTRSHEHIRASGSTRTSSFAVPVSAIMLVSHPGPGKVGAGTIELTELVCVPPSCAAAVPCRLRYDIRYCLTRAHPIQATEHRMVREYPIQRAGATD